MKVDDWILFESKVVQIKEVEGDAVTSVSDGMFEHGGSRLNDHCRPLTRRNLALSRSCESRRATIKDHERSANINWPEIHDKLVDCWLEEVDAPEDGLETVARANSEWVRDVCKQLDRLHGESVGGVRLFRRQ